MNKCEALKWLLDNVKVWPTAIKKAPFIGEWCFSNELNFESMGNPNVCMKITKQNWLDAQPHSDSEGVFLDCPKTTNGSLSGETNIVRPHQEIQTIATGKKIYISGPMTGYADFNRPAFNVAAEKVIADGNTPLNPALAPDGLTQTEYMQLAMQQVFMADAIILLDGWNQSKGARAEYALAEKLGLDIIIN